MNRVDKRQRPTAMLTARIPLRLWQRLNARVARSNQKRTAIVVQALEKWIANYDGETK